MLRPFLTPYITITGTGTGTGRAVRCAVLHKDMTSSSVINSQLFRFDFQSHEKVGAGDPLLGLHIVMGGKDAVS